MEGHDHLRWVIRCVAAGLGRSTEEMFVDTRDGEQWKDMIIYAGSSAV